MSSQIYLKPKNRWLIGLVVAATGITGIIATLENFGLEQGNQTTPSQIKKSKPAIKRVMALGRLEPESEIINLFPPQSFESERIAKLLVKQGDEVTEKQVVAILDSHNKLQQTLQQAKEQVKIANTKLDQVKAGAKQGEIQAQQATIKRIEAERNTQVEAQQATIARLSAEQRTEIEAQTATITRLEAELNNAQTEYQRYETLFKEGATSASLRDSKRLTLSTSLQQLAQAQANLRKIQQSGQQQLAEAQANLRKIQTSGYEQLREAKATLNRIAEVRPVDVRAAQAELDNASSGVQQAQVNLEQTYIRAPIAGRILKINTRVGEKISQFGIVALAQTDQMMVIAEVYQSEIAKVQIGQQAEITGQAIKEKLQGTISQIGWLVNRQNVFSNQPGENLDRRVIEVKIRLYPEDSKRVAKLTNLQVQTKIRL